MCVLSKPVEATYGYMIYIYILCYIYIAIIWRLISQVPAHIHAHPRVEHEQCKNFPNPFHDSLAYKASNGSQSQSHKNQESRIRPAVLRLWCQEWCAMGQVLAPGSGTISAYLHNLWCDDLSIDDSIAEMLCFLVLFFILMLLFCMP